MLGCVSTGAGAGEGRHGSWGWVLGVKWGSSNPNVLSGDGAPWGASSQRCLPAKGSTLRALPQPEGLGAVICTHRGSGKGLLQPHLLGKCVPVLTFLLV